MAKYIWLPLLQGVEEIIKALQLHFPWPVGNEDSTVFSFRTPEGLCLIGISEWFEGEASLDIRWRVFLGEITHEFDYRKIMRLNNDYPETPYGIFFGRR